MYYITAEVHVLFKQAIYDLFKLLFDLHEMLISVFIYLYD